MVGVVRARSRQLSAALAALALVAAAAGCRSKSSTASAKADLADSSLSWVSGKAESANGTPPKYTVASVCGSATDTYLAELLHTSPTDAKVLHEWGDIVAGGREVMISGKVTHAHLGPSDLPMSHPYGYDLSLDVGLDKPFLPFAMNLGPVPVPDVEMHTEVSSGLIPHATSTTTAGTWADQSDQNMKELLPGFEPPAIGDRILVMGRWVIDCGHDNFQTELHPMSFMAWAHTDGSVTTVHLFYNPYRDTETYTGDPSSLGQVDDATRLKRPDSKPFPQAMATQVFALLAGGADRLHSQELIEATHASPVPFAVCAPGARVTTVSYDLVTRAGVNVSVTPPKAGPCTQISVDLGNNYKPVNAQVRQCLLPWTYLDTVAGQAVGGNVDVLALLKQNVPVFVRDRIAADPDTTCAAALTAPPVDVAAGGQHLRTDDNQPFPVYGVVRVVPAG